MTGFGWQKAAMRESPCASGLDEVLGPVGVTAGQRRDLGAGRLVLQVVEADERHRMHLDGIRDHELHPCEPDAVDRQCHQRKAAAGLARFSMTRVRVFGTAPRSDSSTTKSAVPA